MTRQGAASLFNEIADPKKKALMDFVRDGGGFLGVHSAADTFNPWPEYGALIGGDFDQHAWHQEMRIIADRFDPLASFIGLPGYSRG